MHRRRVGHNYQSRRIYLITMTVEGRRPLLGTLVGNANAPIGAADAPRIELTELGLRVRDCWMAIERHYPDIKILATQVMPDHLHGILFVQQDMEVHMSQAIKGFKTGTNKVFRELCPSAATMSRQRQTEKGGYRNQGFLWTPGFNDHILEDAGELERWFEYLRENPRRLAIRRAHANYFRVRFDINISGQTFAAIGNRFLLDYPQKLQVQLSRSLTDEEIHHAVEHYLSMSKNGYIMVSPAISKAEQAVMRAILDAHRPLIFISPWGFNDFSHPGHQYYEACAEGRFLILAPWPHQNRRIPLTRDMCLALNAMTKALCSPNGNKLSQVVELPDANIKFMHTPTVISIADNDMSLMINNETFVDGKSYRITKDMKERKVRVTHDYSADVIGTWEGHQTSDEDTYGDGLLHRWEYKTDGTFVYYRQDDNGEWVNDVNSMAEYFVDGVLFCTRWKNVGDDTEYRESWEIASIEDGIMKWTAVRAREDGTTYTATFEMKKVK